VGEHEASHLQEERAAKEAAEARADSARAEAEAEITAARKSLGTESAQAKAAREALEKEVEELKLALAQVRSLQAGRTSPAQYGIGCQERCQWCDLDVCRYSQAWFNDNCRNLAQARTATDAMRAQLTAEKIQAQQRTAGFEKVKQEIEVRPPVTHDSMHCCYIVQCLQ
jgi:multidrug resistance efflux pump